MIIVDERNHLKNQFVSQEFDNFDFFQNVKVMNLKSFISLDLINRSEIALIDVEALLKHPDLNEGFNVVINIFFGIILFYDEKNPNEINWIKKVVGTSSKILGVFSNNLDKLSSSILVNQLQFVWKLMEDQKTLQKQLARFSIELEQVLQTAQDEMMKTKKIYETLIPRRSQEIKGIAFSNKYLAGDGGGAEFFDLVQGTTKIYQVLVTSQSYLITSSVMGILSRLKEEGFRPEVFMNEVSEDIRTINKSKNKNSEYDLFILEIDPITLKMVLHTDSKVECYSQNKGRIHLHQDRPYQMEKGEKIIVFSSGFIFNWMSKSVKEDLEDLLRAEKFNSLNDLMSELFFQLKESLNADFATKDSTVLMMEVKRHGIHKI
jgi:hypothetical protein